jgi:hypothetical protein
MAKRGERGIGEREHARVYPNARSDAEAASKANARVGRRWCHLLWKSVCFSMCAGNTYWCHFSAKSLAISTNGSIRSESRLLRLAPTRGPLLCVRPWGRGPVWVKTGSALVEHKISASPPKSDIRASMSTRPKLIFPPHRGAHQMQTMAPVRVPILSVVRDAERER